MTQYLFIMFGYPGSGKSSFARQLAQRIDAKRISQDNLRKITFQNPRDHMGDEDDRILLQAMNKLTREILTSGASAIYDANVKSYADRELLYKQASGLGVDSYLIWAKTLLSTSIIRNVPVNSDETFTIAYTKMVSDYRKKLEEPHDDEHVIVIDGEESFAQQYKQIADRCFC